MRGQVIGSGHVGSGHHEGSGDRVRSCGVKSS